MSKRIGIFTSGGDCAGLNAAIRGACIRAVETYGWKMLGIHRGTTGLITDPLSYTELTPDLCDTVMLRTGGTILASTNKDNPFQFPMPDGSRKDLSHLFCEGYKKLKLDALIGIGGDGSMNILHKLAQQGGLNVVAIPKTIDNDLSGTENAIGFATAVDTATEALDRLQSTAAGHQRIIILEVMGRDAGHIALSAGIAGGADIILIPEIPYNLNMIYEKLRKIYSTSRKHALVIVSEAVKTQDGDAVGIEDNGRVRYGGIGQYLSEKIQKELNIDARVMVLGHLQRGGQPSAYDRIIGSAFGVAAVDLIAQNTFDHMVAWNNQNVTSLPIVQAIDHYKAVDPNECLVKTARGVNICFGDA